MVTVGTPLDGPGLMVGEGVETVVDVWAGAITEIVMASHTVHSYLLP